MKKLSVILLSLGLLILIDGCGLLHPKPAIPTSLDSTLPVVKVDGHIQDMRSIAFQWKPIHNPRVTGIGIYRSNPKLPHAPIQYHALINNRFATHFTDTGLQPNTAYRYFFTTFSKHAQSMASATITVSTSPGPQSVTWIHGISGMPKSAKIIWRPDVHPLTKGYIIQRLNAASNIWVNIAKLKGRLNSEYIDTPLASNKTYQYRVKVYTYNNLVSLPSKIVTITTKPLPHGVQNLQASKTLAYKIKLSWSPVHIKTFAYYKIYRSKYPDKDFTYYAKVTQNHFTDHVNHDGKTYYYKVTVVDNDGLQSNPDIPAIGGMTRARPARPVITMISVAGHHIHIAWFDNDPQVHSFILIKKEKINWLKSKTSKIAGITTQTYNDMKAYANKTYSYQVIAIGSMGLQSQPSKSVSISSPNLPIYHKPATSVTSNGSNIRPTNNLNTNSL